MKARRKKRNWGVLKLIHRNWKAGLRFDEMIGGLTHLKQTIVDEENSCDRSKIGSVNTDS